MRKSVVLLSLAAVSACSSRDSTAPKSPPTISMEIVAGDSVTSEVGTKVPLTVRVTDVHGSAVPNQLVNWVVTGGEGTVFVGATISDNSGIAKNQLTLAYGDNVVELRAIDAGGNPVTYAVIHDLGGHLVDWRPLIYGDTSTTDGSAFVIHPGVPYDFLQHLTFQLRDAATEEDIPNLVVPISTIAVSFNGDPNGGSCDFTDLAAVVCTGNHFSSDIQIYPLNAQDVGPMPPYLWGPALFANPKYPRAFSASIEERGAPAPPPPAGLSAQFLVTCNTRHVCFFDASPSVITLGIGPSGYNWYFGDGYQGTKQKVEHDYPHAGQWTVTLSIWDTKGRNAKENAVVYVP
jgi:hypothetical protein